MDITEIVKREYRINSAKIDDVIEIIVDGKRHLYRMIDNNLYLYKEEVLVTSELHTEKFNRILRTATRDKNLNVLTDE